VRSRLPPGEGRSWKGAGVEGQVMRRCVTGWNNLGVASRTRQVARERGGAGAEVQGGGYWVWRWRGCWRKDGSKGGGGGTEEGSWVSNNDVFK
jgi:hypothetical protein